MKPVYKFAVRKDLVEKDFLPKRATARSTGWDVFAAEEFIIRPGEYVKIPLGFRVISPNGWWLKLVPRSSSFVKKNLHCLYGTIDEDYRGYMFFCAQYMPDVRDLGKSLKIEVGEAVGQLIPVELNDMVVDGITNENFDALCEVEKNDRKTGGFGSTTGFHKTGG